MLRLYTKIQMPIWLFNLLTYWDYNFPNSQFNKRMTGLYGWTRLFTWPTFGSTFQSAKQINVVRSHKYHLALFCSLTWTHLHCFILTIERCGERCASFVKFQNRKSLNLVDSLPSPSSSDEQICRMPCFP